MPGSCWLTEERALVKDAFSLRILVEPSDSELVSVLTMNFEFYADVDVTFRQSLHAEPSKNRKYKSVVVLSRWIMNVLFTGAGLYTSSTPYAAGQF